MFCSTKKENGHECQKNISFQKFLKKLTHSGAAFKKQTTQINNTNRTTQQKTKQMNSRKKNNIYIYLYMYMYSCPVPNNLKLYLVILYLVN